MDFTRETFAAFSDALLALYAAPDRETQVAAVVAPLRSMFAGCAVTIESREGPADSSGLLVPIEGTALQLVLRRERERAFSDREQLLATQLATHLAAAIDTQRVRLLDLLARVNRPRDLRGLGLSPRECEVLHWILEGKRDAEIAQVLGASPRTVHKHVENLLRKLGVETRLAAARTAADWLARRPAPKTS